MTPSELLDVFREEMVDDQQPTLWSDSEAFRYMNDAQIKFCQWGIGIADSTTPGICDLDVTTGQEFVPLSPRILQVRKAYLGSSGRELELVNLESAHAADASDRYFDAPGFKLDTSTGAVTGLILGMERNKARYNRIPAADDTLRLVVWRLPLKRITEESTKFELDEQYVETLLLWMKCRAFRKDDAQTRNDQQAEKYEAAFRLACEQSRLEQQRRDHVPREIQFSW